MSSEFGPLKGSKNKIGTLFGKMLKKVNLSPFLVTYSLGITLTCDESLASMFSQLTRPVAEEFGFTVHQELENLTPLERHLVTYSSKPSPNGGMVINIRRQLFWTT